VPRGPDETVKADYFADEGDPRVERKLEKRLEPVGKV
jgi:hypothetical protein